jgi:hypothetical protein
MVKLNFPPFEFKLKKAQGKVWIFDGIRKKYIVLTPEEWVRQHLIHYLTDHLNYPKSLIRVESGLRVNELMKRSDVVVYDRNTRPWMIVECKSVEHAIGEQTAAQVSRYNTSLKARYVVVTNGLVHRCFEVNHDKREVKSVNDFPIYSPESR